MKKIKLTQNKHVFVDDIDFDNLSKYKWYFHFGYAMRTDNKNKKTLLMHRIIMNTPIYYQVDHINGNTLDNRRDNLRNCLLEQNKMNIGISKRNTSGFKGVHWYKKNKKWGCRIGGGKTREFLGLFKSKIKAMFAYNQAAIKKYGIFARLNEI